MAAVAIVAIVAGIAGADAWMSFRAASGPSNSLGAPALASGTPSPVLPNSTRPQSPGPTFQVASGPALAEHESILQTHRTATGGWLLTGSRLLVTDGPSWRTCWASSNGNVAAPYPIAFVAGDAIRLIDGLTLWTSTDGCASWTQSTAPIAGAAPTVATGMAFPTESTGYVAYSNHSGSNQEAQIYKTDDGGRHWRVTAGTVKAVAGPNGSVFDGDLAVAFADADHGWLTDTHTLWTTANGGGSWTRTVLPVPSAVHGQLDIIATPVVGADGSAVVVAKYDATPGMDGARGQRVFYRTVDRGAHWTAASVVADPGTLEISVVDPTTWIVLDPSKPASIQTTTDAGSTWRTIAVREVWPYNGGPIDFADSLHGWMVVSESEPPCPGAPNTICDYAYGPPQHLVATDDGGATWVELKP
jgi:photosystem II stability/assembly factor-like uncharacterized protein